MTGRVSMGLWEKKTLDRYWPVNAETEAALENLLADDGFQVVWILGRLRTYLSC